jgi:hypothetical protein
MATLLQRLLQLVSSLPQLPSDERVHVMQRPHELLAMLPQ